MKYHIDTIPVWDAMKQDGECLLCALERKTELGEAERYLGASVMEPDIRVQVNAKGFCRRHHGMLYGMSNRLGHALMLESHMIETRERTAKVFKKLEGAGDALRGAGLAGKFSGKGKNAEATIHEQATELMNMSGTCLMCDTIEENMMRYLHTFFHLYKNDTDFRNRFASGKGLCLPHTGRLLEAAPAELGAKDLGEFVSTVARLQTENLDRMQEDISWFIKKFDYRYEKESWGTSKDAVERTVNKLRGWCVGKEPGD
ncbi:MAG: hypothetical protein IKQ01_06250 [Bacteroidales bacterium]|nr:hypothetical protein [Bacteroidales bacterium]